MLTCCIHLTSNSIVERGTEMTDASSSPEIRSRLKFSFLRSTMFHSLGSYVSVGLYVEYDNTISCSCVSICSHFLWK